jgi:hypothetical protein
MLMSEGFSIGSCILLFDARSPNIDASFPIHIVFFYLIFLAVNEPREVKQVDARQDQEDLKQDHKEVKRHSDQGISGDVKDYVNQV